MLVACLDAIDLFVSDDGLAPAWRETITSAGATLLLVPAPAAEAVPDVGPARTNRPA